MRPPSMGEVALFFSASLEHPRERSPRLLRGSDEFGMNDFRTLRKTWYTCGQRKAAIAAKGST